LTDCPLPAFAGGAVAHPSTEVILRHTNPENHKSTRRDELQQLLCEERIQLKVYLEGERGSPDASRYP
jgi:hypothetical protein